MTKAIVIIGTLDTKGEEVAYVRDLIQARGRQAWVIDPGVLDQPTTRADSTREEVARAGGAELADLIAAGDKAGSMKVMTEGTRAIVLRMYSEGRLGGVIALGGGQGTATATPAMKALPIGVPKVMVSTIASGRNYFGPYVGTTDVTMMHSVADILGVNAVTRRVFGNAAAAVCAMAEANESVVDSGRVAVGITMLGLTTPLVLKAKELLQGWGYDVIGFHANGTGGQSMERLIEEGLIQGVLDVSTQELTSQVCHGLFDAGPERMLTAGRKGLPQVVVPGGTDYIVRGPLSTLPEGERHRNLIVHNPNFTLVRTAKDEMAEIGRLMASRLNQARGPVAVMIPLGGFSFSDRPGHALYDPEADRALVAALESDLNSSVELVQIEAHLNDPLFAEMVAAKMRVLMERRPDGA